MRYCNPSDPADPADYPAFVPVKRCRLHLSPPRTPPAPPPDPFARFGQVPPACRRRRIQSQGKYLRERFAQEPGAVELFAVVLELEQLALQGLAIETRGGNG